MKRILFLLLGLTIAVSASADVNSWRDRHPNKQSVFAEQVKAHAEAHKAKREAAQQALDQRFKSHNMQHKATTPTKLRGETPEAIHEQPEGTLVTYQRSGDYAQEWSGPFSQYGNVMVVYDPDGTTVYVKGLAFGVYESGWVTGTIANGKITIPLGQYVWTYYEDGEYWYGLYLTWGSIETDQDSGYFVFTPDPNVTAVTYTIDGDNIVLDNSNGGNEGDGATGLAAMWDDGDGFYKMEWSTVFTPHEITIPTTEIITEQPEGELVTYGLETGRLSSFDSPYYASGETVDVVYAADGETVYIKDLIGYYEFNSWVRGTISGGKIHVPLGQFIYFDLVDGSAYLDWGSTATAPENDEGPMFTFTPDPTATEVTFTIDGDNLIMDNSTEGNDGDGTTGLAMMIVDYGDPFFVMDYNTFLSPYVEPTVIEDLPEGELVTYTRTGDYFSGNCYEQGGIVNIVYAPDGETVYIQDIMCYSDLGSWVMGTLENGKIHVPMKQYLTWNGPKKGGDGWGYMLAFGQITYDENDDYYYYDYDPNITEATFTINGDVISLDNSSFGPNNDMDGATGLVAVYSDAPSYFVQCDINTVFTEFDVPTIITDQPEGELVTYLRNNLGINYEEGYTTDIEGEYNVVYAPDGETVYIQNPIAYVNAGTWVRGTLVNGKITVPLGQYIWTYFGDGGEYYYGLYLEWGSNSYNGGSHIFTPDPNVTEVTYTINGDYLVMDNSMPGVDGDGAVGLAASWDDGYGSVFLECAIPSTEIIDDQPEGTLKKYFHSTISRDYGYNSFPYVYGEVEMIYSETSDTVYIKDPITGCEYGTWVTGTIEGNKIYVPTGQYLQYNENYGYYTKLYWIKETPHYEWIDGAAVVTGTDYVPDYDRDEVTYTINGDMITMDDHYPSDNNLGIGAYTFSLSGERYGYNGWDYTSKFVPYFEPTVLEDMPEGTLVTYNRRGNAIVHMDELMKSVYEYPCYWPYQLSRQGDESYVVYDPDGRTVYMYEPVQCRSNMHAPRYTWVMGALSDDGHKIIVPLEQYVSWNSETNLAERLAWGTTHYRKNSNDEYEIYFTPDNSVMTVTYSLNDDGSISMDNSSGTHAQPINYEYWSEPTWASGNTGLAITDQCLQWRGDLNWTTTYAGDHPAVPMDPVVTEWEDNGDENGNSALLTFFELTDVDGFALEEEGLSYSIYTDRGELFTFKASEYGLDEDVTEVTYDMWQNNWRLNPECIYFYRTNAEGYEPFFNWRIGIQLHYTYNGVKQSSNIVYLEVFEEPEDPSVPGDSNGDGIVNISDVTSLIDYLLGTELDNFSEIGADVNGDGVINISDVTFLIDILLDS